MKPADLDEELRKAGQELLTEVPDMIRRRQDEVYASLADLPMQTRSGRSLRTKKVSRALGAAAAAAVIGVMSSAYISPVMAETLKKIPVVGSIFQLAKDLGLQTAEERGLVDQPNASVTHEGVTLSIPQVVYDGIRLSMAVKREGEGLVGGIMDHKTVREGKTSRDIYPRGAIIDMETFINGTSTRDFSTAAQRMNWTGKPTSDPNAMLFEWSDFSHLEQRKAVLTDQFQLKVKITLEGIAEPFIMEIPVHKNTEQIVVPTKETRQWGSLKLTLKQLKFTPITTAFQMDIEQTDPSEIVNDENVLFEIWDDQGRKLGLVGGLGIYTDNSQKYQRGELLFDRFEDAPKSITLKAFQPEFKVPGAKSGAYKLDSNGEIVKTYLKDLEITIPVNKADLTKLYDIQK
ncbi:DUF4179 domain-containing protein [Paenibacillus terreus]|uniref:DUF4179 domain-containing protein n=1 Tax=Paenibacillus terreus TaxID=1387834 RepID=A0ABV5BB60_9BACL